jgi:peptidoglycan/xylan/chitin deacetylase (PgdA/CDA1 family)
MKVINICFHGIGAPQRLLEPDEDRYWISKDLFIQVLDEVTDRSDVAISFDDGNVSDIEVGLDGLVQHNRQATFFVLAGRLGQTGSLSGKDLEELQRHGMKIGSHGMDHVPWRFLGEDQSQAELVEARQLISQAAGEPVVEAALPLGQYDRTVLSHLKRLGYRRVFSSDRRRAREGAWLQPRFSILADDTIERIRATVLASQKSMDGAMAIAAGVVKRLR